MCVGIYCLKVCQCVTKVCHCETVIMIFNWLVVRKLNISYRRNLDSTDCNLTQLQQ